MTTAHINRIGTALPPLDIHGMFVDFMNKTQLRGKFDRVFSRMVDRAGIFHRYSVLPLEELSTEPTQADCFYSPGKFPSTARRMRAYERFAPDLAERAVAALDLQGREAEITHLVVASCTGFSAPGLDQMLAKRLRLRPDLQRSMVGFMGCSAAVPALQIAQAAVLANPAARVLVVNLELCSLHMQNTQDLEKALLFLVFGDGCSAALVTADAAGIAMQDFRTALLPDSEDLITWHIGDDGFDMTLSGKVPGRIMQALQEDLAREDNGGLLRGEGTQAIDLWAVHGGGRSILDAVESGFRLDKTALEDSRSVLAACGNMSSATVMFVLERMLRTAERGKRGLAMAFGPGVVAETFPVLDGRIGLMDFSVRSRLPELMDDPGLDSATYQRCLGDLAALNRLTLTHRPVLRWLAEATSGLAPGAGFSVLDVAYGQGDLLRAIAVWAEQHHFKVLLSGIDLNPRSAIAARASTPIGMRIEYLTGDVFAYAPAPKPDFIVSSQFTHHLDDAEIISLLGLFEKNAVLGWYITDLHRHPLAYYGFPLLATLARWHRIVRHDGMISIARGFRKSEWRYLLARAGTPAKTYWHLPFRHGVARLK